MSRLERIRALLSRGGVRLHLIELLIVFLGVYGAFALQSYSQQRQALIDEESYRDYSDWRFLARSSWNSSESGSRTFPTRSGRSTFASSERPFPTCPRRRSARRSGSGTPRPL